MCTGRTAGDEAKAMGRIINVASVTLSGGWANLLPYVTSKGALVGMTRALARELGPFGITVNCVSPGAFPTDAEKIHPDPNGDNSFILDRQSVKRRGRPGGISPTPCCSLPPKLQGHRTDAECRRRLWVMH